MVTDSEKTALENLIAKIKTQQEIIAGQAVFSSIDIDLQLDYIRTLYEHYISLKQELTSREKTEKKSEFPESGMLPFFDNGHNDITKYELQIAEKAEDEKQDTAKYNMQDTACKEKNEGDFLFEEKELFENEAAFEEEKLEEREDDDFENDVEMEDEDFEDDEEDIEEEESSDEEDLEDYDEEDVEEEETEEDSDWGENEQEIEEQAAENTKKIEEDTFATFPEMEIEMNLPISPEIDIDAIEFEEDEDENTDTEDKVEEFSIPHIGTSGQPRYWGDELDVEPAPAAQPTSLSDKYISSKPTLNEIVSGFKPDESIGMKLQHASVSDLMKSIDMNLKFLFVKNLFKGNGSVFTEEINKINSIGKLHEAIKYVEEIKDKYNWDDKSEAYTELYKLVLRKYAR